MEIPSEVTSAGCLYVCLFAAITIIYLFTDTARLSLDFTLRVNDTANLTLPV